MENLGASPKKMILLFWCGIPCTQQFQIGNSRNQSTDFNLSLPAQISCVQAIYFRCGAEEAVISLFSQSTLYIAFSKCKVSSFWFLFNFSPLTHIPCLELIYFWKLLAPHKRSNNIALFAEQSLLNNFKVEKNA